MKRFTACVMVLTLIFSSFASFAVSSSEIADDLQEVYAFLEQAEKDYMSRTRADLQGLDQGVWDSVLSPLMGPDLPVTVDQAEIEDFILGLTQIYFNTDSAAIAGEIDLFKTDQAVLIDKLFGSETTIDDLMDLLYATKVNVTSTLDGGEKLQLTTASGDSMLIAVMEDVLKDAVVEEINTHYTDLRDELGSVGWSIDMLLDVQNDLLSDPSVTYGTEARVAVANATVRSEASVASGDLTPTVGDTITYSMNFFDQETNLFKLSSQSSLVSVDGRAVTMEADGTATIYVHRLSGSTVPADYDYIYKFDIEIEAESSGDSGGGTVAPPPAPPIALDLEDLNEEVESLADGLGDVDSENEAMAVVDAAGDLAMQILNMVEGIESQEDIEDAVDDIMVLAGAVAAVSEYVESSGDAEDALAVQANLMEIALSLVDVSEGADQMMLMVNMADMLASADELIVLLNNPSEAKDLARELISAAADLKELAGDAGELIEKLDADMLALAKSYVDVASRITVGTFGQAVIEINENQMLDLAEASQRAVRLMESDLRYADVEILQELQIVVTLRVADNDGAVQPMVVLPTSSALPGMVDRLSVQFPAATIEISTVDLALHMGKEMTVTAAVIGNGSLTPEEQARLTADMQVYEFEITSGGDAVDSFAQPLTIRIPLEAGYWVNAEELTIFHLLADGTLIPMGGHFDGGMLVYRAPHASHYVVDEARKHFSDVTDKNWAKDYIELLAGKGIINGKSETVFDPYAPITRAEFTVLLMKAMAYNGVTGSLDFADVRSTDWFAHSAAAAYQNGIVGGKGNKTFAPYDYITRQEMAKMIANVLVKENYKLSSDVPTQFSDISSIGLWAVREVQTAVREGIISGMPDGTFRPLKNATRAEAATMVYQLFTK